MRSWIRFLVTYCGCFIILKDLLARSSKILKGEYVVIEDILPQSCNKIISRDM